ncbi:CgeB family protein [Ornithinimicrobium cryptoxanthini]|uniref:Glycosyltransferase n=1 Tax=Ornithinimicrobium cryptoxanthini TaxID=2934161 RepID=A0ABY4YK09_9MICO|nr:glycosyltransferase [Ornithinimicrobium cryptoxanthini]USQ76595.1 glycosyltransferase [Ornithinimicrobium cryptoxanthini]
MGERVLVVGPAFHGYSESLATALRVLDHEVATHPYDLYATVGDKLRNKVRYELPERLGRPEGDRRRRQDLTVRAIAALRAARPDAVVVIRGDLLGADFWQTAEALKARTVLWLYDELRRMEHDPETLRRVDTLITYSPLDAESLRASGVETHCIANAFDDTYEIRPEPVESFLFVGARYPNRQRAVERLVAADVPVLAVGRDWSHHLFDRLRTWQLARPDVPARRDVSRSEAYNLMAGALGSLNIHTDQDGFTMRTFETGGAGGLQLIDRPDVSEFYDPGTEVAVFTSEEEMVELARRAVADRSWARKIGEAARRRTLAEHTFVRRARKLEQVWG